MHPFRRLVREPEGRPVPAPVRDWRLEGEFDSYLGGVYVEWTLERGRLLRQWAWINPLAHGTVEELESRAAFRPSGRHTDLDLWWQVIAFLAGQVLARTHHDPVALDDVQRRVLVPFELHAAGTWVTSLGPGDFGTAVLRLLEAAPRSGR